MTDLGFELHGDGGLGKNPITQLGKIVQNGFKDEESIKQNKGNSARGLSKYPGPVDDDAASIYPREIVYGRKVQTSRKRFANGEPARVLSTVNGAFEGKDSLSKIINSCEVKGISLTRSLFDSTGRRSEVDVVVQTGGMTTIDNNGPKRINNGDPVYAEWPDPKGAEDRNVRGSTRMRLITMPYDININALTEHTLESLLRKKYVKGSYEDEIYGPLVDAAQNLDRIIKQMMVNAVHVLLATGVCDELNLGTSIEDVNIRRDRALAYSRDRSRVLRDVRGALWESGLQVPEPTRAGGPERMTTLPEFAMATILGKTNYLVDQLDPVSNRVSNGQTGMLVQGQQTFLGDLFAVVNRGNEFTKSRILGKALTPAEPGGEFDIMLSRYCM